MSGPSDDGQAGVTVTDADWETANALVGVASWALASGVLTGEPHERTAGRIESLSEAIAAALAAERARAHESFLPNNPDVGKVAFRVEAWPHDSGANGEAYHAGHTSAVEAARALRDIAQQIDGWADPECPWVGQEGHSPATPEQDNRAAEEAKARAYAIRRTVKEGPQ